MPAFDISRYLSARTAHTPSFSPDGDRLAFIADITGVPQLWQVDSAGGWPDQLTFTADRVMGCRYGHQNDVLVYSLDSGGNERSQLYALRGHETSEIAVDPAVMHVFGAISADDRLVAYSHNRRHPAHFDVYINDLDGSRERCIFQQDGSNFVADWSPDGTRLIISRTTGSLDQELFLLDVNTREAGHLTPHTTPVSYSQATFSLDGRSIYLITDQGSEFRRAGRLRLDDRALEFLTPDDVDIDWLALAPDGQSLALVRNRDGYGMLSILSLTTGAEREAPGLPAGVVMQPEWSNDSCRLAFALTAAGHNSNIWVWDVMGNASQQVTRVSAGGIPADAFVAPELVRFPSFDGREIPAFLYLPAGERPPVVVHVHGGPEGQAQPIFNPIVQFLVGQGFAVLAPNVRGSTGYGRTYTHLDDVEKRMDSVADLFAATQWLETSGRVDADRMAVWGGSYGGFMVLAAITAYPDVWSAAVDIVGIANFDTFLRNTSAYRRHWRIPEYGDPAEQAELFRTISPIHHIDRIQAPLFVIHGDNDPRVPLSEAEQIVEALRQRGRPVEFMHFADEGHGIIKLANKLELYPRVAAFLNRYLNVAEPVSP